ncbi:MAG: hypothetical protein M3N51_01730 [Actinomycetota bacterium]|nr:hypothetical protein [Actinomycetota bacterium]
MTVNLRRFALPASGKYRSMAEALLVRCKACGESFTSPQQVGRSGFQGADLAEAAYECPHCGQARSYDKVDHYFGSIGHSPGASGSVAQQEGE